MQDAAIVPDMSLPLVNSNASNQDLSIARSATSRQLSPGGPLLLDSGAPLAQGNASMGIVRQEQLQQEQFERWGEGRGQTQTEAFLDDGITGYNNRNQRIGDRHDNRLVGNSRNNKLFGQKGNDRLLGKAGNDRLVGGQGDDYLMGGRGRDRLLGGSGDDLLLSSPDKDIYQGGKGKDTIRFRLKHGTKRLSATSIVKDFEDGKDIIDLGNIRFEDLQLTQISKQSGKKVHTRLQHQPTGNYLLVLKNVAPEQITIADIQSTAETGTEANPINPDPSPVTPSPSPVTPSPSPVTPNPTLAFAAPVPDRSQYNVIIGTNGIDRPIEGTAGNDWIEALDGGDRLEGGDGDDFHFGGVGKDIHLTGSGNDIIFLRKGDGHQTTYNADVVKDFEDGKDRIQLQDVRYSDLNLIVGVGKQSRDTLIRNYATKQILLVIKYTDPADITLDDFILDPKLEAIAPTKEWVSDTRQISPFDTKFHSIDTSDEAQVKGMGGATVTIGSQRVYIGYRQVSSVNQNPVIVSFDDQNPRNNWERSDYEVTNADSKGYGLFWSGTDLYAVFGVDGTQGSPSEDYRRASADATTPWLRTYGQGGGAKVAIVGRIDLATGELLDAAYISAVLKDNKSNTLSVNDLSLNDQGNLLVRADSRFYPRKVDGSPMVNVGDTPAPFDYTVELTPDLKRVVSTSAVGVQ